MVLSALTKAPTRHEPTIRSRGKFRYIKLCLKLALVRKNRRIQTVNHTPLESAHPSQYPVHRQWLSNIPGVWAGKNKAHIGLTSPMQLHCCDVFIAAYFWQYRTFFTGAVRVTAHKFRSGLTPPVASTTSLVKISARLKYMRRITFDGANIVMTGYKSFPFMADRYSV